MRSDQALTHLAKMRAKHERILAKFIKVLEGETLTQIAVQLDLSTNRVAHLVGHTPRYVMHVVRFCCINVVDYEDYRHKPKSIVQYRRDKERWMRCIEQYRQYWRDYDTTASFKLLTGKV
jgi:hypothetical protein